MTNLEAQAATLEAINSAKHKAAGKTHRLQINVYGPRGAYVRTVVFYVVGAPNATAAAVKAGTKSISDSILSAVVSTL